MKLKHIFSEKRKFKFPEVPEIAAFTVSDFFNKTSRRVLPPANCIIAMHKMLIEYANDALGKNDPARFLSRLHESVAMGNGLTETRRGGCTIMADGLNYVFASNYFARVIYVLTYCGWSPNLNDFKDMISKRRICIGYPYKRTNGERRISAYPTIRKDAEYYPADCFYTPDWYLAHIVGVMDPFVGHERIDLRGVVLPRGKLDDWNIEAGLPVRRIQACLSKEEKEVVVAQFLRFLDPINYVLVPNQRHEMHSPQKRTRIGEEPCFISYLKRWMHKYVNEEESGLYEEFCKLALAPVESGSIEVLNDDIEKRGSIQLKVKITAKPMKESEVTLPIKEHCKKTKSKKTIDVASVNSGGLKAVRRMKLWSQRPGGHPYKIIRAFLLAQKEGIASRQLIEDYCTNQIDHPDMYIECFTERGSWGSLMSDAGNNYGHVFERLPECDKVKIWAPVMEVMEKYRNAFLRDMR